MRDLFHGPGGGARRWAVGSGCAAWLVFLACAALAGMSDPRLVVAGSTAAGFAGVLLPLLILGRSAPAVRAGEQGSPNDEGDEAVRRPREHPPGSGGEERIPDFVEYVAAPGPGDRAARAVGESLLHGSPFLASPAQLTRPAVAVKQGHPGR